MPTQQPLIPGTEPKPVTDQTHPEERRAFEYRLKQAGVDWADLFAALMLKGFKWREAAVCAWMIPFKEHRTPATQKELAEMLGCSPETVSSHMHKPSVQLEAMAHRRLAFLPHVDEVMEAHLDTVKKVGGRQTSERMRFLEEMGIYKPRTGDGVTVNVGQAVNVEQDLSQLSENELRRIQQAGTILEQDPSNDDGLD